MKAARKAIYARLSGDTGAGSLTELAPGGVHYLRASQKTPPAGTYVVMKKIDGDPLRTFKQTGGGVFSTKYVYLIKALGRNGVKSGPDAVEDAMERVKTLLEDHNLSVPGFTTAYLRWERDIPDYVEEKDGGPVYHAGTYFRLELE